MKRLGLLLAVLLCVSADARNLKRMSTPSPAPTFDYYVAASGCSDSNNGTSVATPWCVTSLQATNGNWASTAGKRVGFLPGVYDVSSLMPPGTGSQEMNGALTVHGGLSGTQISYWGSSDSSGHYSARTATIDAKGASNLYAGHIQSVGAGEPSVIVTGGSSVAGNVGWVTIDGLRITGFAYKAIRIGGKSSADGNTVTNPVIIENNELWGGGYNRAGQIATYTVAGGSGCVNGTYRSVPLTGGSGTYAMADLVVSGGSVSVQFMVQLGQSYVVNDSLTSTVPGCSGAWSLTVNSINSSNNTNDNCVALWLDASTYAVTATNNWIHDDAAHIYGNGDHLTAIIVWGFGSLSQGTTIQYSTVVNAGNIYGKEGAVEGSVIQYNYLDVSASGGAGLQSFDGNGQSTTGLTETTVFSNNIVIMNGGVAGSFAALGGPSNGDSQGWMTPVQMFNNTIIAANSTGLTVAWMASDNGTAGVGALQYYNNIYACGSGSCNGNLNGWGNWVVSPQTIALEDYNLTPTTGGTCAGTTATCWTLYTNSGFTANTTGGLPASISSATTFSAYATALAAAGGISGAESHSVSGAPTFVGTGSYAAKYQLTSGSLGHNTGSTNGTTGGSATDMGAWGNGATQIGCNFAT